MTLMDLLIHCRRARVHDTSAVERDTSELALRVTRATFHAPAHQKSLGQSLSNSSVRSPLRVNSHPRRLTHSSSTLSPLPPPPSLPLPPTRACICVNSLYLEVG